ncbi:hypothetical protein FO519_001061 [Halicephalobus sp. NKZ332]|nr:hypothetical protein FO519_001061 [Halicephalobus sp. NKZ332]
MTSKVRFPSLPNIGGDEYVVKRPSIIAHRKGKPPENPKTVDPLLKEEIDQVLATNFQVRNGFLVQAHPHVPPQPLSVTCSTNPSKTVVLFTGDGNSITWKSRSLPGTADEIESYPCRVCNRVFLTGKGLESHASEEHPDQLTQIKEDITAIATEWRCREIQQKKRQIGPTPTIRPKRNIVFRQKSPGIYEVCPICDVAVKVDTPDALEKHKQRHIHLNGQSSHDLTCVRCSKTFASQVAFVKHMAVHNKRSYVCRIYARKSTSLQRKPPESANVSACCGKCNLSFQKAELLVKHYFTVHQQTSFTARIRIKGMPDYLFVVKNGDIGFQCCNTTFNTRSSFTSHRSSHIQTSS